MNRQPSCENSDFTARGKQKEKGEEGGEKKKKRRRERKAGSCTMLTSRPRANP